MTFDLLKKGKHLPRARLLFTLTLKLTNLSNKIEDLIDNGGIVLLRLRHDDRDELSEEFFCRTRNIASLFQGCFDEDEERRQSSKKLSCLSKLWCKVIWPSFFEQMLVILGGNRHLNCPFRL